MMAMIRRLLYHIKRDEKCNNVANVKEMIYRRSSRNRMFGAIEGWMSHGASVDLVFENDLILFALKGLQT